MEGTPATGEQALGADRPPGWFLENGGKRLATDRPASRPTKDDLRIILAASLVLIGVLMCSMALPWFTSAETPSWTPFSHWLDLGWSPGTQNWGFLLLGLGATVAVGTGVARRWPRRVPIVLAFAGGTGLLAVALLEATAHLSVNPGPDLQADFGAFIGCGAALLAWAGLALSTYLVVNG